MKKLISLVLLLSLCLGLFAGCDIMSLLPGNQPATPAVSNLDNAKSLVFNTYKPANKDEIPVKSADFEVITSVLVDGETFNVAWALEITAGPADSVKLADGSSPAFKKVDVTEKPTEDVKFTLTATISDANGNSTSVSFNFMTPKFEAPAADKVVIKLPSDNKYTTGTEYEYTSSSGSKKMELVLSENKAEAIAFTMIEGEGGVVSFKTDDGYFLSCDATNVEFVTTESDYTKFVLEVAEGGYFIKCAVANYNNKAQYLEVYSGYLTCYGMGTNTAIYTFALEKADGATGTVTKHSASGDTTTSAPATSAPATSAPATSEPATNPILPGETESVIILNVDSLGIPSQNYTAGTQRVNGAVFQWQQLGNYGNGLQVRDKDGKTSIFWNTYAFGAPIVKIELVYSSTMDVTHSNPDAEIFSFGNALDNYTYTTKLSTTAGTKTYTITPDAQTYTFMKFEHDLGYSMYWESITIYLAGGSTNPPAGGDVNTPATSEPATSEPATSEPATQPTPSTTGTVTLTVDSLGIPSQNYTANTATVDGVTFQWQQLGNYGNGLQVRDKDGKTSMFWNTTAFGSGIEKIELVYSSTMDVTHSNPDAEIFSFGNGVDSYTYTTKLSTTAGTKTYTITPDAQTYTYLKFEHDLGYTMYWESITIHLVDGTTVTAG